MLKGRDHETRSRLLSGASRLFAERGYTKVTVRDICLSADANVAAVNYHYGGKLGLYEQVVQSAIQTMQATTEEAREAGRDKSPEQQLRAYVRVFITRIVARAGRDTWIHELMMREISDPTPALDLVLEQVIRPRMAYLCGIVGQLLGFPVEDARVWRCAFSIHAQCLALMNHPIASRLNPAFAMRPHTIDIMVDHITEFSLAGLQSLAR